MKAEIPENRFGLGIANPDDFLRSMEEVVHAWRREHGDVIARELLRAYLTGLDHGCKILSAIGEAAQTVLFAALEGN